MGNQSNRFFTGLLVTFVIGQVISYFIAPDSWKSFIGVLPKIISMIALSVIIHLNKTVILVLS